MTAFSRCRIDAEVLVIPVLSASEGRLTRAQIAALEAIDILTCGHHRAAADERAIQALARRAWNIRVVPPVQLGALKTQGLIEAAAREGCEAFWRMTHEGRLEHFAQRVEVFA